MEIKRIHFETIDSTNNWAKAHLDELDQTHLTLITADEQTAGRGRFKRSWISPKKTNILATFVFFQKNLREDLGNIPQILALSALRALEEIPLPIKIKWPNDLVINEKKLGGILCEVQQTQNNWGIVAGIGINVNMTEEWLKQIDRPAASLFTETGIKYPLESLIESLKDQFTTNISLFLSKGFSPFLETFKEALIHKKNSGIKFHDFQNILEGQFLGINPDGSLNLLLPNGTIKRCINGELI